MVVIGPRGHEHAALPGVALREAHAAVVVRVHVKDLDPVQIPRIGTHQLVPEGVRLDDQIALGLAPLIKSLDAQIQRLVRLAQEAFVHAVDQVVVGVLGEADFDAEVNPHAQPFALFPRLLEILHIGPQDLLFLPLLGHDQEVKMVGDGQPVVAQAVVGPYRRFGFDLAAGAGGARVRVRLNEIGVFAPELFFCFFQNDLIRPGGNRNFLILRELQFLSSTADCMAERSISRAPAMEAAPRIASGAQPLMAYRS